MSTCELLTMAALLAAGTCVAGEIAVPYDTIRDIPRLKAFKGRNCEFCNVGSNSGLFGFDWESAGVNGANFATGPQSLAQGFALLEHFADRLAAGCTVFIPICPFSSISVPDRYGPERQYKIYPFMRGEDIYLWTPERAAAVAKAVDEAEAKWTGCDSRLAEPDKAVTPKAFRRSVESLLACWRRDFEIDDFAAPLSGRNRAAFAANAEVFRKGLETCRARGWRPIVVLPPVTRYYDAVFTDKVWRQYVDDFVAAAHAEGVPYWDYSRDERFRDEANFRNSLMLNRRGSALFTKELVRRAKESSPRAGIDRAFLKELLEIPSVTADIPAVNRAVDLTRGWLEKNAVRCQTETDVSGRKILWASTVEGKTPDYVLAVHLDVVPAEVGQFAVRVEGERIFARGAHDCKGNAAIACEVLRRLNGKASVGVVFASDEELGGSTTGLMVKRGYRPRKMGIVVDAGTYGVFYAQKGNSYLTVRATGKGGHSSCALWLDNPIAKLTQGYEKFRAAWPAVPEDGWGDLVVPTVIRAGRAENAIPDTAEMVLNVRSVSTDAVARVTAMLKDAAGLEVVNVRSTGGPMASDPNDPEIQRLLAGRRAKWPEKNGMLQRMLAITDARHFAGLGVPVVIVGSLGGNAHGKDEWGDLVNMDENAEMLEKFLEEK